MRHLRFCVRNGRMPRGRLVRRRREASVFWLPDGSCKARAGYGTMLLWRGLWTERPCAGGVHRGRSICDRGLCPHFRGRRSSWSIRPRCLRSSTVTSACTHSSAVISLPGQKIHHTTDSGLPFYLTHDIFQAGMCNDEPGTRETHCGKRQNMCPKFHANTCILPRNMV